MEKLDKCKSLPSAKEKHTFAGRSPWNILKINIYLPAHQIAQLHMTVADIEDIVVATSWGWERMERTAPNDTLAR